MSDIFVSYKAEDRARVRPLVGALETDGLTVWWDAHLGGGEEWRESIQQNLAAARCVIVAWSKRSVGPDGRFVRDEATRALRRRVYLPVRIDKVEPPLGFGETQALPLIGWKGDRSDPRYRAVLGAAQAITAGKPHVARGFAAADSGVSRRTLIAGSAATAAVAGVGGWLLLKPGSAAASDSIAVLPFANLSGDPDQAYFSDGMAEELRSALSRIAGLKVVARTSSELLRDSDAKTAARKLGVAHILTGSVRRSPSTIRVSAQLIDGENGMERWSESFDRPSGDVLQVQAGIAESVAQQLSIRLAGDDRSVLIAGETRNPEARDLLLRAASAGLDDTEKGARKSLALLESALALDANYAAAHAGKALMLAIISGNHARSAAEAEQTADAALVSANRALVLAPRLASGYATRGFVFRQQLNLGAAFADMVRADALPGSDAAALRNYALMLSYCRRHREAIGKAAEATSLDPINPVSLEIEAHMFFNARLYEDAMGAARRSLRITPSRQRPRSILANALLFLGRTAEADTEYRRLEPDYYRRRLGTAVLAVRSGDRDTALADLNAMKADYGDSAHYQYAEVHAQLGDLDRAFEELDLAFKARDPGLAGLQIDPFLDPIRRDSRYHPLVRKLDFPTATP